VLRDFEGRLWTQDVQWIEDATGKSVQAEQWGITTLISKDGPGLNRKPGYINRGDNSGYQAINLAGHLLDWYGRIILVGFDMMLSDGKRHWFGEHPEPMNASSSYPSFISHFRTINPADYGLEIWNCSRRTALDHFPKHRLEEALEAVCSE